MYCTWKGAVYDWTGAHVYFLVYAVQLDGCIHTAHIVFRQIALINKFAFVSFSDGIDLISLH